MTVYGCGARMGAWGPPRAVGGLFNSSADWFTGAGLLLAGLGVIAVGASVAYGVFVEAPRERKYAKRRDTGRRRRTRMTMNSPKRYLFTHDPDGANPEDAPARGTIQDAIDWALESSGFVYLWDSHNRDCGYVTPEGEYIGEEKYDGYHRMDDA